uniref:Uncharacterized protein n=1 Tax=Anguilla anguilla TaxID=7936 RepID=A0A0E9T2Q1_ANGAN
MQNASSGSGYLYWENSIKACCEKACLESDVIICV